MKKKEQIEEEITFNSVQEAQETYSGIRARENRQQVALILSGVGTLVSLISVIMENMQVSRVSATFFMLTQLAPVFGIIAYILAGGFMDALKMALKLGKLGWRLFPIPLLDLAVGLATMLVSIMAFLYAPVLFVYMNIKRSKQTKALAEDYIKAHGGRLAEAPKKTPAAAPKKTPTAAPKTEHVAAAKPQPVAEDYKYCGFCGAKLKKKSKFCIVCGKSAEE